MRTKHSGICWLDQIPRSDRQQNMTSGDDCSPNNPTILLTISLNQPTPHPIRLPSHCVSLQSSLVTTFDVSRQTFLWQSQCWISLYTQDQLSGERKWFRSFWVITRFVIGLGPQTISDGKWCELSYTPDRSGKFWKFYGWRSSPLGENLIPRDFF